jgi:hypothetical protein
MDATASNGVSSTFFGSASAGASWVGAFVLVMLSLIGFEGFSRKTNLKAKHHVFRKEERGLQVAGSLKSHRNASVHDVKDPLPARKSGQPG